MNFNQNTENAIMVLVASYIFTNDSHIEKKIAQLTLEHVSEIPGMTVEQMAALCGVSVSSYLRYCRSIGYTSYTQFKMRITETLKKYLYIGTTPLYEYLTEENFYERHRLSINNDFDRLERLLDTQTCHRVVDLMVRARKIYMVDLLYSTVRFGLHGDLCVTGKNVTFLLPGDDLDDVFKKELNKDSFVLIVNDRTPRTQGICTIIPQCKALGACVVVLTCEPHFLHDSECDEILVIGSATSAVSSIMIHDLALQYLSTLYRERHMFQKKL